ncbi:MAG TPA: hypothetical protein PKM50_00230 [Methanoregula sp.]|nr:hypothetical protein [Methanoregula sp.]
MHRTVKPLAIIIIVLLAAAIVTGYFYARETMDLPHISPGSAQTAPIIITQTFPFEKGNVTLTVPIDAAVYYGAKSADKSVSIYGNISEKTWVSASYLAMTNDAAQDKMYADLITRFRMIRDEQNLSSDEYLELIAAYTQSLTYETTPDNPAKFPIETVVDGAGDCDDKSLLLAGLLSREGYKVALFSFSKESHMALGIGSTGSLYRNTGYAYLETTNFSYTGIAPDELKGGTPLTSEPLVIPIGDGSIVYSSGEQTAYIHDIFIGSKENVQDLEPQIEPLAISLNTQKDQIARLESRMQTLKNEGNFMAYNSQVSGHNKLVEDYNSRLATCRHLITQYEKWVNIHNYIISHAYDRKGTYEWVKANTPVK